MNTLKPYILDSSITNFKKITDPLLSRILCARGMFDDAALNTSLSSLPDPNEMLGMQAAVTTVFDALASKQRILVVGDYDVDGATATTVCVRGLRAMGADQVDFLVPNRFDYGYGLSPEIAEVALAQKPDLVITVDNGITSIAGVDLLRDKGIKVVVTDHHLPGDELPNADAILNPNQPNCRFPSKNLAGVGVIFYLLMGLRRELRQQGWFRSQDIEEPKLEHYLDLVALGTVADLVFLDQVNRVFVVNGLKLMASGTGNIGIKAIFDVCRRDIRNAVSQDLGFAIGPRINAAGRLADIREGICCLLTDSVEEARKHALNLHHINQERRDIQQQMTEQAEEIVSGFIHDLAGELPWGLCCYENSWHQGVVGLVASRIKDRVHRPTIAFALADASDENCTELKGSARSIASLHVRDLLADIATEHPGLIKKFGGHAMAAGLSISVSDYPQFKELFDAGVRQKLTATDLDKVYWSDGELEPTYFNLRTAEKLKDFLPWGQGIAEPMFHGEFQVKAHQWLKEKHLRLTLTLPHLNTDLAAIWFNATPMNDIDTGASLTLIFRLTVNEYLGDQKLQLQIVDQVSRIVADGN